MIKIFTGDIFNMTQRFFVDPFSSESIEKAVALKGPKLKPSEPQKKDIEELNKHSFNLDDDHGAVFLADHDDEISRAFSQVRFRL